MAAQDAMQVSVLQKVLAYFELASKIGEVVPESHVQAVSEIIDVISSDLLKISTQRTAASGPGAGSPFDPNHSTAATPTPAPGTTPFNPPGTQTQSNVPAPAPEKPKTFTFTGKLYRDDIPSYLRQDYFATNEMAQALATFVGGAVYNENQGAQPDGAPIGALFIKSASSGSVAKPWNAGDLYRQLQNHPTYQPF